VAVIGASYAGLVCAEAFAKSLSSGFRVVLIEKNSHLNYTWLFPGSQFCQNTTIWPSFLTLSMVQKRSRGHVGVQERAGNEDQEQPTRKQRHP